MFVERHLLLVKLPSVIVGNSIDIRGVLALREYQGKLCFKTQNQLDIFENNITLDQNFPVDLVEPELKHDLHSYKANNLAGNFLGHGVI